MSAVDIESSGPQDLKDLENLNLGEKIETTGTSESSAAADVRNKPKPNSRRLPFDGPAISSTVPERPQVSEEEEAKYEETLAYVKSVRELPTSFVKKNKETAPLSELEKYFLSRECILRYLRATKWNVPEAKKRLEGTIVWRREYGTDAMTAEMIEPEVPRSISHCCLRQVLTK